MRGVPDMIIERQATGFRVRPATVGDAARLAPVLRKDDLREIRAATRETPLAVLKRGYTTSDPCYAIVQGDDALVAMFGVVPESGSQSGIIWLLASDALASNPHRFLRHSRTWIDILHRRYRVLWNHVDARNEAHIDWLHWCGFHSQGIEQAFGVEGRPFHRFVKVRESFA